MKTPRLDEAIKGLELELQPLSELGKDILKEYKAIKQLIKNTPIVSTPDNPVWVVDEYGDKKILLADFGDKCMHRYITVSFNDTYNFLCNEEFDWTYHNKITSYTSKVTIEVAEDEAVKVEEFLKTLRK
jgi:hypothetical protein